MANKIYVCAPGCASGRHGEHGARAVSRVGEEPAVGIAHSAATLPGMV